jgi:T5SS/PEP-CTERM-associated repeat protein
LSNTAALYFGNTDGYDNLAIENGGHFVGTDFFIQGADDVALVTGPGSTMKNTGSITLWGGGMLVISNGGQVVNSEAWWWFGYDSVLVTGAGSVWSNRSDLWMGWDFGSNQSLIIANGGKVFNENGYTASGSIGSGNNSVLVTGTGSLWHNSITVNVGGLGPFCSLIISNGGQVVSSSGGYVDSTGGGSTVLVTDPGSIWSNGFSEMIIGEFGTGNGLVISNGGKVVSTGFLSCLGLNPSASNNSVVVAGLGSVWSNSSSLYVGYEGTSNLVQVAGGSVVATNIIVGVASAACNNLLKLDSGSLIVTNNGAGVLEVRYGQLILNGGVLQADTLVITNPCAQFVHTGGMLIVGKVVLDPNTFRLVSVARQSNDMLITWMMGPGATNTLQATAGDGSGGYSTNGFTDIFLVTNNTSVGTVTNYLDIGAATNTPARYYRARLAP